MKIIVEIIGNKFKYNYEVGEYEKGHGEMPLGTTGLDLFTSILKECHRTYNRNTAQQIKEIECMAYIEKHPEIVKKYKRGK